MEKTVFVLERIALNVSDLSALAMDLTVNVQRYLKFQKDAKYHVKMKKKKRKSKKNSKPSTTIKF